MSPTVASGASGSGSAAELLLQRLETVGAEAGICSLEAAAALGLDHQVLVGAVKSLQSLGQVRGPSGRRAVTSCLVDPRRGRGFADALVGSRGGIGSSLVTANGLKWLRVTCHCRPTRSKCLKLPLATSQPRSYLGLSFSNVSQDWTDYFSLGCSLGLGCLPLLLWQ